MMSIFRVGLSFGALVSLSCASPPVVASATPQPSSEPAGSSELPASASPTGSTIAVEPLASSAPLASASSAPGQKLPCAIHEVFGLNTCEPSKGDEPGSSLCALDASKHHCVPSVPNDPIPCSTPAECSFILSPGALVPNSVVPRTFSPKASGCKPWNAGCVDGFCKLLHEKC